MDEDTNAGITLHDNVKKGFTSGESYDNHRPTYTEEATRFVLDKCNFEENDRCQYDILELGAGTGLFTRQLLNCANQKGLNVIATDPLDVFLVKLRAALPGVKTMQCSAESIPLPSCSVKNVVAAQSLHWFANNKAFTEINRVLVPGGKLVFLWNTRDRTQNGTLTYEIATHMLSLVDNTSSHEIMDGALWKGELENCSGYSTLKGHCFYQHLKHSGSKEFILEYIKSHSFISKLDNEKKGNVEETFKKLLDNHPDSAYKDKVDIVLNTEIFWCQKL